MLIAGIDEAGRGPVLGPMTLAITTIEITKEEQLKDLGVKDSKQLTKEIREKLYPQIKKIVNEYLIYKLDANEIDELRKKDSLNLIELKTSAKLLNDLKTKPEKVFVDCPDLNTSRYKNSLYAYLDFDTEIIAEHKADDKYPIVSAASILAKVDRDNYIAKMSKELNFDLGSGYPGDEITIKAITKLEKLAPNFIRKSWQTYIDLKNKEKQKKLF